MAINNTAGALHIQSVAERVEALRQNRISFERSAKLEINKLNMALSHLGITLASDLIRSMQFPAELATTVRHDTIDSIESSHVEPGSPQDQIASAIQAVQALQEVRSELTETAERMEAEDAAARSSPHANGPWEGSASGPDVEAQIDIEPDDDDLQVNGPWKGPLGEGEIDAQEVINPGHGLDSVMLATDAEEDDADSPEEEEDEEDDPGIDDAPEEEDDEEDDPGVDDAPEEESEEEDESDSEVEVIPFADDSMQSFLDDLKSGNLSI